MTRKVCIVLTTRGNYAKMKSTMRAIQTSPDLELQLVVGGAVLDPQYGDFVPMIEADGFHVDERLDYIEDGKSLLSVTLSAGRCISLFGEVLNRLNSDVVMVVADRYEALSIAQAALCMNIHIAHLEGGELSGSIDERIRHAITKLAHIHFPANEQAASFLEKMGEHHDSIFITGTPSLDQIEALNLDDVLPLQELIDASSSGAMINLQNDYIVVSQHPVVTEYGQAKAQFIETCQAVKSIGLPCVWILPNDDAGAQEITAPISSLQDDSNAPPVRTVGGLVLNQYIRLLKHSRCLVGNTSSGIRESAFLGVPVVNIGTRQHGRQRGQNVIDVGYTRAEITIAAKNQIQHGPYPQDTLYGDGHAGKAIAQILAQPLPPIDKSISYIMDQA